MALIRIGGLSLFGRTNASRSWVLAAYHSPHSLTWRWLVAFSLGGWETRRFWPIWMPYRTNDGWQLVARIPWLGMLRWQQQRPMWYRDLYRRMRDEQDRLSGQMVDRQRPEPPRIIHFAAQGVYTLNSTDRQRPEPPRIIHPQPPRMQ